MISIAERLHRDLLDSSLVDAANAIKDAHKHAVETQTDIALAKGHLDQAQTLGSITPGFPLTNVNLAKHHLEEAAKFMAAYTARLHPAKNEPVIDVDNGSSVTLAPSAQDARAASALECGVSAPLSLSAPDADEQQGQQQLPATPAEGAEQSQLSPSEIVSS